MHLDKQHARQEVQRLADRLSEELSAEYAWEGDRLAFKRSGASGYVQIADDAIDVEIRLGLVLAPMKKSIENKISAWLLQANLGNASTTL